MSGGGLVGRRVGEVGGDGDGARRTKINRKSMEQCLVEKTGKRRMFAAALFHDCSTQLARGGTWSEKYWFVSRGMQSAQCKMQNEPQI